MRKRLTSTSILVMIATFSFAQNPAGDTLLSCFLHITKDSVVKKTYRMPVRHFKLHYQDSAYSWTSKEVVPIDEDSTQFFIKAEIPARIYNMKNMITCAAYVPAQMSGSGERLYAIDYGGVQLSDITLHLNSTPAGADVYLFPNRFWTQHLEKINWQKDLASYWKFKVATSTTNTFVKIDQTVYVVVFKLGNQFKQSILYTKPESVQNTETISVNFQ